MMYKKVLLFFLIIFFSLITTFAQLTKIIGKVISSETKEPIPFVNLILKGTHSGSTTNFDGEFSIQSNSKSDTLIVSCVGFLPKRIKINPNHFQNIEIPLVPTSNKLNEVVVRYSGNPADRILDSIIKYKNVNNSFGYNYIQYEAYNKIQFDINNIDEKFMNKKAFKKFNFIFNYIVVR